MFDFLKSFLKENSLLNLELTDEEFESFMRDEISLKELKMRKDNETKKHNFSK